MERRESSGKFFWKKRKQINEFRRIHLFTQNAYLSKNLAVSKHFEHTINIIRNRDFNRTRNPKPSQVTPSAIANMKFKYKKCNCPYEGAVLSEKRLSNVRAEGERTLGTVCRVTVFRSKIDASFR